MAVKGLLTFACVIFLAGSYASGRTQTLDSLIRVSLQANPDLQAAAQELRSAEYRVRASGMLPDPTLSLSAVNMPRGSFRFDETPMTGVVIGISQSIPWPSKLTAESAIARLQAEIESFDIEAKRRRIVRLVRQVYYEYSYWTLSDEILDDNLELSELLIASAETSYANGLGSAQDVLRAKTAESRLRNRKLEANQKRHMALTQLARLTDNPRTVKANLSVRLPELPTALPRPDTSLGLLQNPYLAAADIEIDLADKNLSLATADYWPDINIGLDYRIRTDTQMDPVRGEDFISARIGLSIPLWFLSKQRNLGRSARAELLAADARKRSLRRELEQQLADSRISLERIKAGDRLYEDDILPQARAAFDAARIAYEVGRVDFNGLLSAQLELLEVKLEKLNLLLQYQLEFARLDELLAIEYER